jgi:hypothetical protein
MLVASKRIGRRKRKLKDGHEGGGQAEECASTLLYPEEAGTTVPELCCPHLSMIGRQS